MIRSIIQNINYKTIVHTTQSVYNYNNITHSSKRSVKRTYPILSKNISSNENYCNENDKIKLIVSIVGPPNAGKSTLFNRLMCKESNKSYKLSSEKKKHGKRKLSGKLSTSSKTKLKIEKSGVGGAIVSNIPGTTRDKRECIGRINNVYFTLYDTAGLDCERFDNVVDSKRIKNELKREMTLQTLNATKESDLIFIMFDAKVGVTNDLIEIGKWFRKHILSYDHHTHHLPPMHKIVLLANKLEGTTWASHPTLSKVYNPTTNSFEYKADDNDKSITILDNLNDASNKLGFGIDAIPISALHGHGIADLATIIYKYTLKKKELYSKLNQDTVPAIIKKEKPLQLAILGRQNVGKSTLVNTILNSKRVLVGPMPGLTRDAISINYLWENTHPVKIVDTAGIRKVSKRDITHPNVATTELYDDIEDQAVYDAIRAMKTADVAAIVLDAQARYITKQELAIADAVIKEGRALVIVANKMDLITHHQYTKEEYASDVRNQLEIRFPFLRNTPVIPLSSLTGENVNAFMPVVFNARYRWERKISTSLLNSWLRQVLLHHPPPTSSKPIKIKYILQTKGRPPTFLLFCNHTNIPTSYIKYLTKNFQDTFEMFGMEVRLALKVSTKINPFDSAAKSKRKLSRHGVGGRENKIKRKMNELKKYGKTLKGLQKRKEYYR